jgi:hypothetical protein
LIKDEASNRIEEEPAEKGLLTEGFQTRDEAEVDLEESSCSSELSEPVATVALRATIPAWEACIDALYEERMTAARSSISSKT